MRHLIFCFLLTRAALGAHCQMPCGIYHDDMVFDQIDQYIETMYKGMSVIKDNKFTDAHEWNEVIRWVILKEKESDDVAKLITNYFLQQKIKPGEPDTCKQVESAHRLLFYLVAIKQNTDVKFVQQFLNEWDKFKNMFHVEGYQCQIEMLKQQKKEAEEKAKKEQEAKPKSAGKTEAK